MSVPVWVFLADHAIFLMSVVGVLTLPRLVREIYFAAREVPRAWRELKSVVRELRAQDGF